MDMNAVEDHARRTKFFGQFRGIATHYNQIVKLLNTNFSEKKASAYLYILEKQTIEMRELLLKVVALTSEFEKKYLITFNDLYTFIRRLCKTVLLPDFGLIAKTKSSNR